MEAGLFLHFVDLSAETTARIEEIIAQLPAIESIDPHGDARRRPGRRGLEPSLKRPYLPQLPMSGCPHVPQPGRDPDGTRDRVAAHPLHWL